ncbi:vegetative cell wall protein gp1 [Corynascus novoguineensis]|uniref:Vegetative cell wall protein gp1 n=1 Tax=Corynascus novoguineensis TaxID=1126955 RepID=A0AAN7CJE6_9PEZI|nr:vegetative cell wall protein gp1 [Corynascus novoguineensis]
MTNYYPCTGLYNEEECPSWYGATPERPRTQAQFGNCYSNLSPRYTSDGQYATYNSLRGSPPFSPRYTSSGRPSPSIRRPRRNSTTAEKRQSATEERKPRPRPVRTATEADAKRHGIPAGYSLKNWDPAEEPIMLVGSVFDANSLGQWIYDWTVYHHGASSPIGEVASELWLLLIQLAGKIKRAGETVPRIRSKENREMIEDFMEAGDRLTNKLRQLLKACEAFMLRSSAKHEKDGQLVKSAGVEFVETLFGRDRELERTERLMTSVRLWNLRFDTNCEDIIKEIHSQTCYDVAAGVI